MEKDLILCHFGFICFPILQLSINFCWVSARRCHQIIIFSFTLTFGYHNEGFAKISSKNTQYYRLLYKWMSNSEAGSHSTGVRCNATCTYGIQLFLGTVVPVVEWLSTWAHECANSTQSLIATCQFESLIECYFWLCSVDKFML